MGVPMAGLAMGIFLFLLVVFGVVFGVRVYRRRQLEVAELEKIFSENTLVDRSGDLVRELCSQATTRQHKAIAPSSRGDGRRGSSDIGTSSGKKNAVRRAVPRRSVVSLPPAPAQFPGKNGGGTGKLFVPPMQGVKKQQNREDRVVESLSSGGTTTGRYDRVPGGTLDGRWFTVPHQQRDPWRLPTPLPTEGDAGLSVEGYRGGKVLGGPWSETPFCQGVLELGSNQGITAHTQRDGTPQEKEMDRLYADSVLRSFLGRHRSWGDQQQRPCSPPQGSVLPKGGWSPSLSVRVQRKGGHQDLVGGRSPKAKSGLRRRRKLVAARGIIDKLPARHASLGGHARQAGPL
ncbi:hypothetical protein [Pasteuria penetrans]|uniref:hypothetical protein n=1 Tax=Pasteuria penetrans TaxID=86005 RepID=UPI000F97E83E|nr:hypothetical protein [Pasteuria penetrans]